MLLHASLRDNPAISFSSALTHSCTVFTSQEDGMNRKMGKGVGASIGKEIRRSTRKKMKGKRCLKGHNKSYCF